LAANDSVAQPLRKRFVTSADGLRLHVMDYGEATSPWTPVVCLPGLTRTHRDFHELAQHLAGRDDRPRRVLAVDYRGRGESAWSPDSSRYTPMIEMDDVTAIMAAVDVPRAAIVGVSRGGIIGMFMGIHHPRTVAALVLVDVGPQIEPLGLARIKSYVGRMPPPEDWTDAAALLRRLHGGHFTAFQDRDWAAFARLTFADRDGKPVADYDPALAETLEGIDFDRPVPDLWDAFAALTHTPTQVVRGDNSDLLSTATLDRMRAEHPALVSWTIEGEGHAPLIRGEPLLNRIATFLAAAEDEATVPLSPGDD